MPTFQFRMLVGHVPDDEQVRGILALDDTSTVELAPEEAVCLVWCDRTAPTLAEAIVSAALDLERLGLRPLRVEPRDPVTASEAAGRLGRPVESFRSWLSSTVAEPDAPTPIRMRTVGPEPIYSWDDIAAWVRERLDANVPMDPPVIEAATLALRLRRCIQGAAGVEPLLAKLIGYPKV
jgi:hypothetical protein